MSRIKLNAAIVGCVAVVLSDSQAQGQGGAVVGWGNLVLVPQSELINLAAIAAGGAHNLALRPDGSIVAWGKNPYGIANAPLPNNNFVSISAGDSHNLCLQGDGVIVAWGENVYGQCNVPVPNSNFIAAAAGGSHSLGLKQDGSIVAWGYNAYGQCNVPAPNAGFVAVAAGFDHSLGLKEDRSIIAWEPTRTARPLCLRPILVSLPSLRARTTVLA